MNFTAQNYTPKFRLQNCRLPVEILQNCLWMLSINVQLGFWFQPMVGLKVITWINVALPRNIIGVRLDTINMISNVLSDMTVIACRRKPETSLSCADISVWKAWKGCACECNKVQLYHDPSQISQNRARWIRKTTQKRLLLLFCGFKWSLFFWNCFRRQQDEN